ncbi:MAG: PAS domain S-box protein [Burkholderiaceae bacterium]|nr:PAS domain S-box protein [Burkholderiaceae bacterium]
MNSLWQGWGRLVGRIAAYRDALLSRENASRPMLPPILEQQLKLKEFVLDQVREAITEHKRLQAMIAQRESEFRTLIENSPDTVVRFDRQCRRIYCNPAILKLTGYCLADMMGKTIIESSPYPLKFSKALTALVQKVMDTGQPGEIDLYWEKMATPVYLQFRVNPEFDQTGRVVSALSIGRDVTALKLAQERLRKSHDILRALVAHQETEHEKERQDLVYQIHEDLAQNLAALRLNISLFEMSGDAASRAPLLKTMSAIAERSIVRIRDIVSMLRPTVLDLGLVPALQWLTDDFEGVGFQFELALQEDILLSNEVSTFLYRAAQEALINIALHAAATHIHLSLDTVADVCRLVVRDNGCGFDPATPRREDSFGLIRLTEQARHLGGYLSIDSTSDQGTALEIHVPAFTCWPSARRKTAC